MSMSNGMYGPATDLGLMNSFVSFTLVSIGYILADKILDYRIF
jgi:ABC-type polysaccharide transport system permease subunit